MSSLLTNITVIQQLAKDLIRGKQLNYSQECIPYYVEESKFTLENIENLRNISGHLLKASLIRHKHPSINKNTTAKQEIEKNTVQWTESRVTINNKTAINEKCIIFLHGLGSSRLQAMPLVQFLPLDYCLFAFDFSGSGKSEGENITYGKRQAQDIEVILDFLRQNRGIKQFIIWGRSMGAVAALIFAMNLYKKAHQSISASAMHSRIKGLIIDSPFGDFKQITKQIAMKRISVPEFLIQFALKFINQCFQSLLKDETRDGKVYNPFSINLGSGQDLETGISTIFLYSLADQVVNKGHSQAIISKYKSRFEKVVMEEVTHNQSRPQKYIQRVFQLLNNFNRKMERDRRRNSMINSNGRPLLTRNSSMNFDTEQQGYGKRRGISVQSKQKQRKNRNRDIQLKMTEQSFHELNLKKTRIQQYNSQKIQPKHTLSSSHASPPSKRHEKRKNSPLRLKLSNSLNKHPQHQSKSTKIKFEQNTHFNPISQQQQTFYNTISYDNTDILHKKLYRNESDLDRMEKLLGKQTLPETKMGCSKGRRHNQAIRKFQYQLNHLRYL